MPRLLIFLVPLLAIVLVACKGDGESSATPPPDGTATNMPEPIGVTPPDSASEFLNQFADELINQAECTLDATSSEVDCGENGLYAPDPVPADPNAACAVLLVNEEPIAVTCTSHEPLIVVYYAIP